MDIKNTTIENVVDKVKEKLTDTFSKLSAKLPEMESLPYGLRQVFAEVANIPTAVTVVPSLFLSEDKNEDKLLNNRFAITTLALGLGLSALPTLTIAAAAPLYLAGRIMQSINQNNTPPAHKAFKVN